VWEDREQFLIEEPQADTPGRIQAFLTEFRTRSQSNADRSSTPAWRAINIGMRLLGSLLLLAGAALIYVRWGEVGLLSVAAVLMVVFGLSLLVVALFHPGRKPGSDSGSWRTGER
jgi:hypothetical protein